MTYEIQSKSDFQVGVTLTVRIPEADLDQKAIRTIQYDRPVFLIPFNYRFIDGAVEFTYQVGNRGKLSYLSGTRSPAEYADMWCNLLQPLLDCSDWFMNPNSFVLSSEYLYCDKSTHAISFVYIPSIRASSDERSLKSMVMEVAKMNHVTDINFENKVVWAIQEFNIIDFLQVIKSGRGVDAPAVSKPEPAPDSLPAYADRSQPARQDTAGSRAAAPAVFQAPAQPPTPNSHMRMDSEISIQVPAQDKKEKKEKEKKEKSGLFGHKKEKKEKKPKNKPGLFQGRNAASQQEIIGGAAAQPYQPQAAPRQESIPGYGGQYMQMQNDPNDEVTDIDQPGMGGTGFRYIGISGHPGFIGVSIEEGAVFTIGRLSESAGSHQSDFEFPQRTKAVSRRHAAVERRVDGYYIVDLDSSAGTFLNGQKLPPNAPFRLERGTRVSFGFSGADYIWEG